MDQELDEDFTLYLLGCFLLFFLLLFWVFCLFWVFFASFVTTGMCYSCKFSGAGIGVEEGNDLTSRKK